MFEIYRWWKVFESIKSDRLSSQLIYLVSECRLCVTDNVISSLTYVRGKNSWFTGRTSRSTTQTWWAMQDKKKCEEPKIYLNQQHHSFSYFPCGRNYFPYGRNYFPCGRNYFPCGRNYFPCGRNYFPCGRN